MSAVFGDGDVRFELVDGWEKLPVGLGHADVSGVCTDSAGNVYLYCRGEHPVMVYDRDGNFLRSWGRGRFSYRTHGAYMSPRDELFLIDDEGHSVAQYTFDGRLVRYLGPAGVASDSGYDGVDVQSVVRGAGPYNRPTCVAQAPSGGYYVTDGYGNASVHRFSADGDYVGSWGEPGSGPGQFRTPHGIWVHGDGRVFVADRQNDRIQIFDPDGRYLDEWTDVQRPQSLYIDADGLVYVAELVWRAGERSARRGLIEAEEPARLSVYDLDGNVLARWGDGDPIRPGSFIGPHGLWVDDEGSVYVAEVSDTIGVSRGYTPRGVHTFQKFRRLG